MKKLTKLLCLLCLSVGLVSCQNDKKSGSETSAVQVPQEKTKEFEHYGPTLLEAIRSQNEELVIHLIEAGEDYQIYYREGETPFLLAIQYGLENAAFLMIEKGVDLEEENLKGQSALYLSWFYHREKLYQYLLDKVEPKFLAAVKRGQFEFGMFLVKNHADMNTQSTTGKTALMMGVKESAYEFVNFLIEAGANLDLKDEEGNTALHLASLQFDTKMIEVLLDAGANSWTRNIFGKSSKKILKRQI